MTTGERLKSLTLLTQRQLFCVRLRACVRLYSAHGRYYIGRKVINGFKFIPIMMRRADAFERLITDRYKLKPTKNERHERWLTGINLNL